MNVFTHISEWNLPLPEIPSMPLADRLLMVNPAFFDVAYVINPHMEGQIGKVNRQKANNEWQKLVDLYRSLGLSVEVINGEQGLPDMVFCANQTLPFIRPNGEKGVFCAQMHAPERKPEVAFFKAYFARKGYQVRTLPSDNDSDFEGMGDALWHSGRRLLWGGYGFRTGLEVYKGLAQALDVPVLALELCDPEFYHLDTCMCILDESCVLVYPGAFQPQGLALIRKVFSRVIEAPEDEARRLFAVNAFCPNQKHVFIQNGCSETAMRLQLAGFMVISCETGEFIKAGGSVFCMKLHHW
ncbi:MAG TPA: arginine deiminase-related protein [Rhodothermales bacterium]|nr:arginine deiminase-related protein [Rhodothermales bacterium]